MKLKVKSNGKEVTMPKEIFDGLTPDQKRSYNVISTDDEAPVKEQVAKNEVKKEEKKTPPETGDKK